jgi:hypothetical protein
MASIILGCIRIYTQFHNICRSITPFLSSVVTFKQLISYRFTEICIFCISSEAMNLVMLNFFDFITLQEVLGRTNHLFSFDKTRTAQKTKQLWGHIETARWSHNIHIISHNIHYRGYVSTGPLPSNDKGIFTEPSHSNCGGDTLSLIRHGPHWKQRVHQFVYCCVCIHYRGNISTQPLPSNDRGILT